LALDDRAPEAFEAGAAAVADGVCASFSRFTGGMQPRMDLINQDADLNRLRAQISTERGCDDNASDITVCASKAHIHGRFAPIYFYL
jgi:hypothetical protein